jgi:hypothetical protein
MNKLGVLKPKTHSHHQVERCDGSRAGSRLKGIAWYWTGLPLHGYEIYLCDHVTGRSHMREGGERRRILVPSTLGYGETGNH